MVNEARWLSLDRWWKRRGTPSLPVSRGPAPTRCGLSAPSTPLWWKAHFPFTVLQSHIHMLPSRLNPWGHVQQIKRPQLDPTPLNPKRVVASPGCFIRSNEERRMTTESPTGDVTKAKRFPPRSGLYCQFKAHLQSYFLFCLLRKML